VDLGVPVVGKTDVIGPWVTSVVDPPVTVGVVKSEGGEGMVGASLGSGVLMVKSEGGVGMVGASLGSGVLGSSNKESLGGSGSSSMLMVSMVLRVLA